MQPSEHPVSTGGWTRQRLLRTALGGGAVVAGGAVMGVGRDSGTSLAAPSKATDAEILNHFLSLERAQEAFYREALAAGALTDELLEFARTVAAQESEHVEFLVKRLGTEAREQPAFEFPAELLKDRQRFRDSAIALEEATISAYIGQAANLTRETMTPIATVLAVEARQAAWVRDIAGISPAPRAADRGRDSEAVLEGLRQRRLIR